MERAKKHGVDGRSGGGEVRQPPDQIGSKEAEMVAEVCAMSARPRPTGQLMSFHDSYVLHGLHFRPVRPGLVVASYKVPARLGDDKGNLCPGALGTIVDVAGGAAITSSGPMAVTVNMSIQYLANAEVDDELEITSKLLKYEGGYSSTSILVKNKSNGELICICQQLCFNKPKSKI